METQFIYIHTCSEQGKITMNKYEYIRETSDKIYYKGNYGKESGVKLDSLNRYSNRTKLGRVVKVIHISRSPEVDIERLKQPIIQQLNADIIVKQLEIERLECIKTIEVQ